MDSPLLLLSSDTSQDEEDGEEEALLQRLSYSTDLPMWPHSSSIRNGAHDQPEVTYVGQGEARDANGQEDEPSTAQQQEDEARDQPEVTYIGQRPAPHTPTRVRHAPACPGAPTRKRTAQARTQQDGAGLLSLVNLIEERCTENPLLETTGISLPKDYAARCVSTTQCEKYLCRVLPCLGEVALARAWWWIFGGIWTLNGQPIPRQLVAHATGDIATRRHISRAPCGLPVPVVNCFLSNKFMERVQSVAHLTKNKFVADAARKCIGVSQQAASDLVWVLKFAWHAEITNKLQSKAAMRENDRCAKILRRKFKQRAHAAAAEAWFRSNPKPVPRECYKIAVLDYYNDKLCDPDGDDPLEPFRVEATLTCATQTNDLRVCALPNHGAWEKFFFNISSKQVDGTMLDKFPMETNHILQNLMFKVDNFSQRERETLQRATGSTFPAAKFGQMISTLDTGVQEMGASQMRDAMKNVLANTARDQCVPGGDVASVTITPHSLAIRASNSEQACLRLSSEMMTVDAASEIQKLAALRKHSHDAPPPQEENLREVTCCCCMAAPPEGTLNCGEAVHTCCKACSSYILAQPQPTCPACQREVSDFTAFPAKPIFTIF